MKRRQYLLLIALSISLTGLADCHYGAGTLVYKLNRCPPNDFHWPNAAKSDSLEAKKESKYRYPNDTSGTECHKLLRYSMKERIGKDDWSTYNNYVGILVNSSCYLIASTYRIGPNLGRNKSEMEEALRRSLDPFVDLLLKSEPFKATIPAEKVMLFDGRDEYSSWCKSLPLSEGATGN